MASKRLGIVDTSRLVGIRWDFPEGTTLLGTHRVGLTDRLLLKIEHQGLRPTEEGEELPLVLPEWDGSKFAGWTVHDEEGWIVHPEEAKP